MRRGLLCEVAGGRSRGACNGLEPRESRRGLVRHRRVLPFGGPLQPRAQALGLLPGLACLPSYGGQVR